MGKYSYEDWVTKKGRKRLVALTKYNKSLKRKNKNSEKRNIISQNKRNIIYLFLPERFSIQKNPEETIYFFNNMIDLINEKQINRVFYLNMKKVKYISVDAIMY